MTARSPDPMAVRELHIRLRNDAALRDGFHPVETLADLPGGLPEDDLVIAAALSALRGESTVTRDEVGQVWTLRPAVRRKVLEALPETELTGRDTAVAHALTGRGGYQPDAIRRLVRYAEGPRPPPVAVLARRLHTLERAGPKAPAHDQVAALRGALNTAEHRARASELLSGGVFGREAEQARIAAWIARPQHKQPVCSLHVSGLPGIGKSYLLQAAVQAASAGDKGVLTVWLDFDRAGLALTDATAFFEEVSRQIGDALPSSAATLRDVRLQAARTRTALSAREAADASPWDLLNAMGRIVADQPRHVLIVLDTLELLRARGETAVMRLFENLDTLLEAGVAPLAVISAGRGDALDPVPHRRGDEVKLLGLPDVIADSYLAANGVPTGERPAILHLAKGIPLLLKLGLRAHAEGLPLADAPDDGSQTAGAHLYRGILSRLDPPLNAMAQAGLLLHRIHPTHLGTILAPALDLALSEAQADALFHDLATQSWLVEADSGGGWLRHRADIRAAFLQLFYDDQPALAARVNALAAEVLASTDPGAALYHRLQLIRTGAEMPAIDPLAATRLASAMIDELPEAARDALRRARGERSRNFRIAEDGTVPVDAADAGAIIPAPTVPSAERSAAAFAYDHATGSLTTVFHDQPRRIDPRLTDDLSMMLTGGDRREANFLVDKALLAPFSANDPGAVVVLAYLWVSGAWASALRLWRAMGAPFDDPEPALARILREIDAEAQFFKARRRLPDLPSPPASGRSALLGSSYDVALATTDDAAPSPSDGRMRAEALLAAWMPGMSEGAAARLRADAEVRRERAGLSLSPDLPTALGPGLALAPMIPHLVPLTALVSDRPGQPRAAWLARLAPRLPEIIRLQAPWIELPQDRLARAARTPFDMLDLLASSGLLTEAATAMALTLQDPETARLAASAERWRRLSHGLWAFSKRPPHGWRGLSGLDAMTGHLLAIRPQDAERLARLWLPEPEGQARLGDRLRGGMPKGETRDSAIAALRRDLPPGLAVPVALSRPAVSDVSVRSKRYFTMSDQSISDRGRDLIRRAAERGNPVLRELGFDPDEVATAFRAPGSSLESAQPPMFLEAIVRLAGRPPLIVRNDRVEGKTALLEDANDSACFPHDIADRIAGVEKFLPSVGRVEFVNHARSWGGTAWVVQDDPVGPMIVTNRHVAVEVARRTHRGDGVFLFAPTSGARYGARFNTAEEPGSPADATRLHRIEGFTFIADDLQADVAIARLRLPAGAAPQPILLADRDTQPGELVAVVGYPAADPYRNDPTAMERYFRGLYDIKRFSPGRITAAGAGEVLSHDCTTLGGNSGSPVISLERGAAVGLHFAGAFGVANSAVRASTLQALMAGERGLVPGTALSDMDERRDPHRPADQFAGRPGYDAQFLRVAEVPLPALPGGLDLARPSDATAERPFELRYRHFSVLYSAARKMPALCALNIDGGQMRPLKRRSLAWGKDMRLPEAMQLGGADYGDPEIDRGHLVRRAATNWGPDDDIARQSDADSFHYTVCAPQHADLNRSRDMWLGLEDYILSSTVTHGFRANVMAGPVFTPDDPPLGETGTTIPLAFWKVVTMLAQDEDEVLRLHVTAYVLSQGPLIQAMLDRQGRSEGIEGFTFGAFRTFQVRLADLAETLGYDFGTLPGFDPLARRVERSESMALPVRPIDRPGDIVL